MCFMKKAHIFTGTESLRMPLPSIPRLDMKTLYPSRSELAKSVLLSPLAWEPYFYNRDLHTHIFTSAYARQLSIEADQVNRQSFGPELIGVYTQCSTHSFEICWGEIYNSYIYIYISHNVEFKSVRNVCDFRKLLQNKFNLTLQYAYCVRILQYLYCHTESI